MSEPAEMRHASLQHQAHTDKHRHTELQRSLLTLGALRMPEYRNLLVSGCPLDICKRIHLHSIYSPS